MQAFKESFSRTSTPLSKPVMCEAAEVPAVATFKKGDQVLTTCTPNPQTPLKKRPRKHSLKKATVVGIINESMVEIAWGWAAQGEKHKKAKYAAVPTDKSRVFFA